jgi:large subunit ribosomal protein L23
MSAFWKKNNKQQTKDEQGITAIGTKKKAVVSVEKKMVKDKSSEIKSNNKKSKLKKSKKSKMGLIVPEERAGLINRVLVRPMVSEAVMKAQELGKYTFRVGKNVAKKEIALAINSLYKVTVIKVNVMNYKAQNKFFRGKKGNTKLYKKAIVTLKKGDKIKLFS